MNVRNIKRNGWCYGDNRTRITWEKMITGFWRIKQADEDEIP